MQPCVYNFIYLAVKKVIHQMGKHFQQGISDGMKKLHVLRCVEKYAKHCHCLKGLTFYCIIQFTLNDACINTFIFVFIKCFCF